MKTVFDLEEMGELKDEIGKMRPFNEGDVRYFHYPRRQENLTVNDVRYVIARQLGYDFMKHRMITVAIDHDGKIGVALCSEKDRYNRRLGNTIASNRLRDFIKIQVRDCDKGRI